MVAISSADGSSATGPYELLRRLGAGGMGEVFLAWDRRLNRHVALKRIRHGHMQTPDYLRRFRLEARAAAALNHSNIVQIYDLVEDESGVSLVMEYVEGRSLMEHIKDRSLDVATSLHVARQIAEGLHAAHTRGLVHRDLKAENVMLGAEAGQVKILDFGLAKQLSQSESSSSLTRDGVIMGTARAMSPEQAAGDSVDARSDLYSLGVLLYEMLIGHSPFCGDNSLQVLRKVLFEDPVPLSALRPELPPTLSSLIMSLLQKEPERRPRDARILVERLTELEAGLSGRANLGPPSKAETSDVGSDALTLPPNVAWNASGSTSKSESISSLSPPANQASERLSKAPGALTLIAMLAVSLATSLAVAWWLGIVPNRTPTASPEPPPIRQDLRSSSPRELYVEAWNQLRRFERVGNLDRSIEGFQRVVESGEMQAAAHAGLARAYWRKYHWGGLDRTWLDRAESMAKQAVALDSDVAEGQISLALVDMANRRFVAARKALDHARRVDPNHPDINNALARLEMALGAREPAEAALRAALATDADNQESFDLLGTLFYREGRYLEAADAFRKSVEHAPESIIGYRNLSATLFKLERYEDAATMLQKALAIQPDSGLYANLGTLLFFRGLYSQAADVLEKALQAPGGANSYLNWANWGDALQQIPDRGSEAQDAYLRAIQILQQRRDDGGQFGVKEQSRLSLYLAKYGDSGAAQATLESLPEDASNLPEVLYRGTLVHELGGRRTKALNSLQKALAAGYPLAEVRRDPELLSLRADVGYHQLLVEFDKTNLRPRN